MRKMFLVAVAAIVSISSLQASEITIKIKKQYLNLPVSHSVDRSRMTFSAQGMEDYSFDVRLSDNADADYWTFCDVSAYKGKKLVIKCEVPADRLTLIEQSDEIKDSDTFYKETMRPQQHFTFRRGWNNDPNGMVFHDGEYHLFAQLNPYEREWGNMHWGHAVSTDLIHWKELPIALYPDQLGTMFSGTAVIDKDNSSGFGMPEKPAMVAFYTADTPGRECQCVAYSLDNGRNWAKYKDNPVIDSGPALKTSQTRDPKVFWYEPAGHWVLVLFEKDGNSFYTSSNLKEWTYQSHIAGFYECPDFYPLAVDGNPDKVKWVLTAASGVYLTGDFDGKTFTPDSPLKRYTSGLVYAGQTFNDFPDGRRVQIAWVRTSYGNAPFKSSFTTPMEMTLKSSGPDTRLYAAPVSEFDNICHQMLKKNDISAQEAVKLLNEYASQESLRIKCKFVMDCSAGSLVFGLRGQKILNYDMGRSLINGDFYSSDDAFSGKVELSCDIIMDRGIFELYVDDGAWSTFIQRAPVNEDAYQLSSNARVESLEIYALDSIWE